MLVRLIGRTLTRRVGMKNNGFRDIICDSIWYSLCQTVYGDILDMRYEIEQNINTNINSCYRFLCQNCWYEE